MYPLQSLRSVMFAVAFACAPSLALAQGPVTKSFVVDNSDGYGVDTCLATGAACGAAMANAWCRVHDFQRAVSFGKGAPLVKLVAEKSTIPAPGAACLAGTCAEAVTITCSQ